jgi:hypothetical protein
MRRAITAVYTLSVIWQDELMDEASLIRTFTDLTGDTEAAGRAVLMYLDMLEHKPGAVEPEPTLEKSADASPYPLRADVTLTVPPAT